MAVFASAFLASLVFILSLGSLPSPALLVVLLLTLSLVGIYRVGLRSAVLGCLVAILMLSVAFLELSGRQLRGAEVGVDTRIKIQVTSVPQRDARQLRFEASVLDCLSCTQALGPQRLQLSWYGDAPALRAGDTWLLTARLKPMTGLRNPGGFDRVKWAIANGIDARGYVRNSPPAEHLSSAGSTDVAALRERLSTRLSTLDSANEYLGLVQALTLGVRHGVDSSVWDILRQSGTAHLLAISGLHITLLAGWAYVVVRWLVALLLSRVISPTSALSELDARSIALLASLLVAIVYALLAGFGLPAQRAVLMLAVWVVSGLRYRIVGSVGGLSLALLVVLLHNPLSVLTVGFWLSFGTVAALFYLHHGHLRATPSGTDPDASSRLERQVQALRCGLPAALHTHVLLGLLLLPVTAWFFQSGSIIAPLANLLAVPWVGVVVVPLSFLALVSSVFLPAVAGVVLNLAQGSIEVLLAMLEWIVRTLAGSITLVMPSAIVTFLCLGGLLLLLSPRGLGVRWLALPLLLPALMFNLYRPALDGFEAHVLDVGQGLAVLVFSGEQTLLFDTGGKVSSQLSMFDAVVMPFLLSTGRRRIDTLVISHTDEDHSFGLPDVLQRFPDIRLVSSAPLPGTHWLGNDQDHANPAAMQLPRVEPCEAGMQWSDGATVFSILHPTATDSGSDNDRSCVMLVHHGASRVLLTGDIEAAAEVQLARRLRAVQSAASGNRAALEVDLMVAPHHGSKTSSSPVLLAAVRPEQVVFPAGNGNRYGFPHVDVQSRYLSLGVTPFTTGTEGAVSFSYGLPGGGLSPSSWWHSHRRFWHGIVNSACSERFSEGALWLRLLKLAHEGQKLCGK